jgi:hypothetical protein
VDKTRSGNFLEDETLLCMQAAMRKCELVSSITAESEQITNVHFCNVVTFFS